MINGRGMDNCLLRTVLNGELIPYEMYLKFIPDEMIEVAILNNKIDFSDKEEVFNISLRDKDCDKYLGEFKVESVWIDEDKIITKVRFK